MAAKIMPPTIMETDKGTVYYYTLFLKIYCLQKTIAYGDGFLKKATQHSVFFDLRPFRAKSSHPLGGWLLTGMCRASPAL
jgi:hypothetical protein